MAFWWVNHKQTSAAELEGGYIWAPKFKKTGAASWSYDNMRKVQVGDIILSYSHTRIAAIGVALETCREFVRPEEFGRVGSAWNDVGWLISVDWQRLAAPVFPKLHLSEIVPLLPPKYSPIKPNGDGNQGCYLAGISDELGWTVVELADETPITVDRAEKIVSEAIASTRVAEILNDETLTPTEKQQLINARRGQGRFRKNVEHFENACRLTGVKDKQFLIASHIKPWQTSSNIERLDGNNGLLLSPHIDKLFDQGWISFSNEGKILIASPAVAPVLDAWQVDTTRNVGGFNSAQLSYLDYHRGKVFKGK